jgi:hypothetical protein
MLQLQCLCSEFSATLLRALLRRLHVNQNSTLALSLVCARQEGCTCVAEPASKSYCAVCQTGPTAAMPLPEASSTAPYLVAREARPLDARKAQIYIAGSDRHALLAWGRALGGHRRARELSLSLYPWWLSCWHGSSFMPGWRASHLSAHDQHRQCEAQQQYAVPQSC